MSKKGLGKRSQTIDRIPQPKPENSEKPINKKNLQIKMKVLIRLPKNMGTILSNAWNAKMRWVGKNPPSE